MIRPQKCAKVLFLIWMQLPFHATNESDWLRKVNKVRKILVKPRWILLKYILNFSYFLYFPAAAVKELRGFLPPGYSYHQRQSC